METLPDELWETIFTYLESEELWSCLGVSRRSRRIANSNVLWKRICESVGIDDIPVHSSKEFPDLCDWAAAFYFYYLLPIKNWKRESRRKIHFIQLDDLDFIDVWSNNRGAIYYFKTDRLAVHEVYPHGLVSSVLTPVFFNITREYYYMTIGLNKNYIAVSTYNVVVIFKKSSKHFKRYKMVSITDVIDIDDNCTSYELNKKFSKNSVIKIKAVAKDMLWLSDNFGEYFFVINLITNRIHTIPIKSNFSYSCYSPFIATWDENVHVYDLEGKTLLELNMSVWDICHNSKIVALGNKETQRVETWRIRSNEQLMTKSVLYHTDMAIHPTKNLLVLAEKSIDLYRFTCINAINGEVLWRVIPQKQQSRCHLIKILSEYVFIWHSYLSRPSFSIFDVDSGKKPIGDGLLPQSKTHIFTAIWVIQEYNGFKIVSFIEDKQEERYLTQ